MKPRFLRRRLLLCAVSAAALVLSMQAWDRLHGSLYYLQLEELKARWRESGGAPRDRELNEGFKLGYRALERESANSDYRFLLASMHAWRERGLRLWPEQAVAESKKVIENLKAALVRRPSWFEAWILLALVKYQAGEIDHELKVALEKAMETGPYQTTVHHGLAYVALRIWDRLDPRLQQRSEEILRIALNNVNVNEFVVEQMVMTGRLARFRDRITADERLTRFMDKYLEKRKEAL